MIIYTGIEDYILCGESSWEEVEIELNSSSRLVVRPDGFKKATVLRLITTDPQEYLRSEFQPGVVIDLPIYRREEKYGSH
ncbi:MAG: hypothetical protein GXY50_06880 [Syntrophomonadaceae bacterium]|nr:hypothetical protein [Syntrophomonadaceae bacterium]